MSLTIRETDCNSVHCLSVSDENIELLVTIDRGPEIIGFCKKGCGLFLSHKDGELPQGHSVWIASEHEQRFFCSTDPVMYTPLENGVNFTQRINASLPLELNLDIMITPELSDIMVIHSLTNKSEESVKLSIHTETKFNPQGFIFIPQSNIHTENAPSRILTLWSGCKWGDPRLFLGNQYVTVTPTPNAKGKLKLGSNNTAGWSGYINGENAFIKRYLHNRNALYPFYGSSTYAYADADILSIQTASPFYIIEPFETARHVESWSLFLNINPCDPHNELSLDNLINSI